MKKIKSFCAVSAGVALIAWVCVMTLAASSLGIEGPSYVILSPTSSASEIAVTWWDVPEAAEGYVQYSEYPFDNGESPEYAQTARGVINRLDTGYAAFEARMTELLDGVLYYYRVGSDSQWSGEYSFVFDAEIGRAHV